MQIGDVLQGLRSKAGIPQRDLSLLAGYSPNLVYLCESGKCDIGFNKVKDILKTLGYRIEIVEDSCETFRSKNGHAF